MAFWFWTHRKKSPSKPLSLYDPKALDWEQFSAPSICPYLLTGQVGIELLFVWQCRLRRSSWELFVQGHEWMLSLQTPLTLLRETGLWVQEMGTRSATNRCSFGSLSKSSRRFRFSDFQALCKGKCHCSPVFFGSRPFQHNLRQNLPPISLHLAEKAEAHTCPGGRYSVAGHRARGCHPQGVSAHFCVRDGQIKEITEITENQNERNLKTCISNSHYWLEQQIPLHLGVAVCKFQRFPNELSLCVFRDLGGVKLEHPNGLDVWNFLLYIAGTPRPASSPRAFGMARKWRFQMELKKTMWTWLRSRLIVAMIMWLSFKCC